MRKSVKRVRDTAQTSSSRFVRWHNLSSDDIEAIGVSNSMSSKLVIDFMDCWIQLLYDSPLAPPLKAGKPPSVIHNFIRELRSRPLRDTVTRYASLIDDVLKDTTLYGSGSITGEYDRRMKDTPIFVEYLEWTKSGDPVLLQYILTFCYYGKKLKYEDEEFYATAFRDWLGVEEKLKALSLPKLEVELLRDVVHFALKDKCTPSLILAKHGPGYVAEGVRDAGSKVKLLTLSQKSYRAFSRSSIFMQDVQEMVITADDLIDIGLISKSCAFTNTADMERLNPHEIVARMKFVAKNLRTARTICMETAMMMYLQQSVLNCFVNAIEHGLLSDYVRLSFQEQNQSLAQYGSSTGFVDTLDLSAASDSVSLDLVKKIFPRSWLYYMLATRSNTVVYDDGKTKHKFKPKKFAPMGSALCFPTQCIIFASVVILAQAYYTVCYDEWRRGVIDFSLMSKAELNLYLQNLQRKGMVTASENLSELEKFSVYGDDIICDSRVTVIVAQLLNALGFTFNEKKSFRSSQAVRESCGKYYYNGHDVTPTYFTIPLYTDKLSAKHYQSYIAHINELGDRRLHNARSLLINLLMRSGGPRIDVVPERDRLRSSASRINRGIIFGSSRRNGCLIYSTGPRNDHLEKRGVLESRFHVEEVRGITIDDIYAQTRRKPTNTAKRQRIDYRFEAYRYQQWWRAAFVSPKDREPIQIPTKSSVYPRLRWGWTPTE